MPRHSGELGALARRRAHRGVTPRGNGPTAPSKGYGYDERGSGGTAYQGSAAQPYQPYIPPGALERHGQQSGGLSASRVERGELAPVMSTENGLPYGPWRGLNARDAEQLLGPLQLPSRSAALQALLDQILTSDSAGLTDSKLRLIRADALTRSGRLRAAASLLAAGDQEASGDRATGQAGTALVLRARVGIAAGDIAAGCRAAKTAAKARSGVSKALRGEAIVLAGYCAISAGNTSAAGLAAELARDIGYRQRFTLSVLDAIATGRRMRRLLPKRVSVLQYLLLQKAGFDQAERLIPNASPALLVALVNDRELASDVRAAAAEAAARRGIINGERLADVYRQAGDPGEQRQPADHSTAGRSSPAHRAVVFQDAERIRTPLRRTRAIRALVDDARRAKLSLPAMVALKPFVDELRPAQEISWFALTAIEVALASGDYASVLPWLAIAQSSDRVFSESLDHWRVLGDIANADVDETRVDLYRLEALARRGRIPGPVLRRLTTVLDALDFNVPIPLWDAANRVPQSKSGQLPPSGVLAQLVEASKNNEAARTILLVMRAMNNASAVDAHPLALAESLRALKRAGFEATARRMALEAVFASWPRPAGY